MTGPLDARRTPPTAGTYWWLVLGVAAFTVYGSFVPFHFRPRPWADAVGAWEWVLANRRVIESRSDFVANFLLGVPLGFCLLGALRVDRAGQRGTILTAAAAWPLCVLLAAGVEFGQLYFPGRTSSAADVIAQGAGSAAGMLVWGTAGPRLTAWARKAWAGQRIGGTAGRLLVIYLGFLVLIQLLPLDLTLSPTEAYHKLRDRVTYVPFAELSGPRTPAFAGRTQAWLELAALYVPVGLLAAGRPGRAWRSWRSGPRVFGLALVLALGLEACQLVVASRRPSVTDVLIGGAATTLGWAIGRGLRGRSARGLSPEMGLLLGQAWAAVLLAGGWLPFDFDRALGGRRLGELEWVPFAAAFEKNYLSSLEEALTKVLLFAPLGAVAAGVGERPTAWRVAAAVAAGAGVAALVEAGQLFLPSRYPSPTDVIFGAAGGWLGGVAVLRVRAAAPAAAADDGGARR